MRTATFWADTAERALRTAAQAALGVITIAGTGLLDTDWIGTASVTGMAMVISLLMSIVASGAADPTTAGFTTSTAKHRQRE